MSSVLIAVTSAAGKTGQAVVRELRAAGHGVRALVRRQDARSAALARLGAEIVEADLSDTGAMTGALKDVRRAYFCPPLSPQTGRTLEAFTAAVTVNRLEAVVGMSQWLASPRHPTRMTRDMWDVEQRLASLEGPTVTIVNPGFFADNYLRVSMEMAAQLGLYPNFVGDSRNAPPSNDDMARVIAGVLAAPDRFAGRRMRITGPELIGVAEIAAALSKVLGRRVRTLDAPEWLLAKVAAYRGEPRYDMAVFRHYLADHRGGAFAYGGPTDVVREVTGRPAESFEATVRTYAGRPEARRTGAAFGRAAAAFMLAPLWRGYDHAATERQLGVVPPTGALYAMQDEAWKADHARTDGGWPVAAEPRAAPVQPLRRSA